MIKIYDDGVLGEKDYRDIGKHLKSSGVIIYPTETSYAIGANALDNSAVRKIYGLKGRGADKPLPILVKDLNMLVNIAETSRREEDIISKFWPGPLTIIFNLKAKKHPEDYLFAAGSNSAGARISSHPFAARLFEEIDFPLVATSANSSGEESFSDFNELNEKFLSNLPVSDINILAINAGRLAGGSSTIIKIGKKDIEIMREGDNNIKKKLMCSIKNKG
jgi:L-threonylcarbamoyladenylate synthase